jgi:hypothetical protein
MKTKFQIKPLREGYSVRFNFARPILNWEGVGARFITSIYDNFSPKIPVRTSEITSNNSPTLGDIWVKYSIFGGGSSLTLWADRLTLDFPVVTPADYALALNILRTTHDALKSTFPEQGCELIENQVSEHLDMVGAGEIDRFLNQFRLPRIDAEFKDVAAQTPSVKFGIVSEREKWRMSGIGERSQLSATALYVFRTLTLSPVDPNSSFEQKYELAQRAVARCYSALGLEFVNAPAS